jgi:Thiamine pyrophosphate enzyme, central domain
MRAGIVVNVTRLDRRRLEAIVSDRSAPQKHVWRANIILATADGCGTTEIMRGVALAEKLNAPVFHAPNTERPSFPETHRLFQRMLPIAMGPLSDRLKGFDLAIVIGAPVFRYYPYIAGPVLPAGCELLQVTNDPSDASSRDRQLPGRGGRQGIGRCNGNRLRLGRSGSQWSKDD